MQRALALLRIPALLAAESGIVLGLHRLGRVPSLAIDVTAPRRWLAVAPPEDALAAVVRLLALGLGWWLLVTTLAYLLAQLSGLPAAVRATGAVTLPALRRAVGRGISVGVLTGLLATPLPSLAQPVPPPADPPVLLEGATPHPPGVAPPVTTRTPAGAERPATDPTGRSDPNGRTHRVVAGDNLWTISRDRLASGSTTRSDVRRVARYWRRVVEDNHGRLRSGDPDLIHPGETVRLPPLEDRTVGTGAQSPHLPTGGPHGMHRREDA